MAAVTHGNAGGSETLVATPSSTTIATKGLTEGANITLTGSSTAITIAAADYPPLSNVCIVTNSGDITVNNGASVTITFDEEILDPDGMHSTSMNTDRVNILEDGIYVINFTSVWSADAGSAGILRDTIAFNRSGTDKTLSATATAGVSNENIRISTTTIASLLASDYVWIQCTNRSGVNKFVDSSTQTSPRSSPVLSVVKIMDA